MNEANWGRIGAAVRARREHLALTVKDAALTAQLSDTTWLTLEAGHVVSPRSARKACVALRWPTDAYDRLVAGDDPATFPEGPPPPEDTLEARVTALEATQRHLLAALARLEDELSSRPAV